MPIFRYPFILSVSVVLAAALVLFSLVLLRLTPSPTFSAKDGALSRLTPYPGVVLSTKERGTRSAGLDAALPVCIGCLHDEPLQFVLTQGAP